MYSLWRTKLKLQTPNSKLKTKYEVLNIQENSATPSSYRSAQNLSIKTSKLEPGNFKY